MKTPNPTEQCKTSYGRLHTDEGFRCIFWAQNGYDWSLCPILCRETFCQCSRKTGRRVLQDVSSDSKEGNISKALQLLNPKTAKKDEGFQHLTHLISFYQSWRCHFMCMWQQVCICDQSEFVEPIILYVTLQCFISSNLEETAEVLGHWTDLRGEKLSPKSDKWIINNAGCQLQTARGGAALIAPLFCTGDMFMTLHFRNHFPGAACDSFIFLGADQREEEFGGVRPQLIYDSGYEAPSAAAK